LAKDTDGDGTPDTYEIANGLLVNGEVDAFVGEAGERGSHTGEHLRRAVANDYASFYTSGEYLSFISLPATYQWILPSNLNDRPLRTQCLG
jgi:hypothetical protein